MKKTVVLIVIIILFKVNLFSQIFQWTNSTLGSSIETSDALTTDEFGNVYSAGSYDGTLVFDAQTTQIEITSHDGSRDIFIQKTDGLGNLIWVKSIGGNYSEKVSALSIDSNGDLLIAGNFTDTVDFDTSENDSLLTSDSSGAAFILKLSSDGDFVWVRKLETGYTHSINHISLNQNSNLVISGNFIGTTDFDPDPVTSYILQSATWPPIPSFYSSGFILKLTSSGNFISAFHNKNLMTDSGNYIVSTIVNDTGLVYVAGAFKGTISLGPMNQEVSTDFQNRYMGFIECIAPSGELHGFKKIESDVGVVKLTDFQQDIDGNFYTLGRFSGTVDFDPYFENTHELTADSLDYFICKYDAGFNFMWVKTFILHSSALLSVNTQGHVFLSGYFDSTADFNPSIAIHNLKPVGDTDIYILKLNNTGEFDWAIRLGSEHDEKTNTLHAHGSDLYLGGNFEGAVDFNPGEEINESTSTETNTDLFVLKIGTENLTIKDEMVTTLYLSPNPTNGLVNVALPKPIDFAELVLVDYSGKLVYRETLINPINTLNLTTLSSGIYLVTLVLETGKILNSKLVLQH